MCNDHWTDGVLYENYTGRWSRLIADKFIDWLEVKQARFKSCIDMGCGTGALSEALLANGVCTALTCLDRSPAYLSFARKRILSSGVEFVTDDVQNTSLATGAYSLVVWGSSSTSWIHRRKCFVKCVGLDTLAASWGCTYGTSLMAWNRSGNSGMRPTSAKPPMYVNLTLAFDTRSVRATTSLRASHRPDGLRQRWCRSRSTHGSRTSMTTGLPFLSGQGTAPAFAASLHR